MQKFDRALVFISETYVLVEVIFFFILQIL
jgi:hypothetical protein